MKYQNNVIASPCESGHFARMAKKAGLLILAVAPVAAMLSPSVHADTWTGAGVDNLWSDATNWDTGAPVAGTALLFSGTTNLTTNNNIAAGTSFGGMTFDTTAGSFTLDGNSLTPGGNITNNSTNTQTINLNMALGTSRNFTTVAGGSLVVNGVISGTGSGVTINGDGSATFGAANTYTGGTNIDGGTLVYNADNNASGGITFGATPTASTVSTSISTLNLTAGNVTTSSLAVQTNTSLATPETISIGTGKSLTVNGAFTVGISSVFTIPNPGTVTALVVTGNSLVVNGGANNFQVAVSRTNAAGGTDPKASIDLSSLSNFSYTGTTGQFVVGTGNAQANMTLANMSNTITAAQVRIGDSLADGNGSDDNNPNNNLPSVLLLGNGTNVLNTPTIIIGSDKGNGNISFANLTAGTLTIAGITGGPSTADITVGQYLNGGSSLNPVSALNLAGHNVTVQAGNVTIGSLTSTGTSNGTNSSGNVTFDTGTFNAVNLKLGVISNGTMALGANGTFILGTSPASTGVLNVTGTFNLGARTVNTAAGKATATFIVNGGTANIGTDIVDASTFLASGGTVPNATTLVVNGGTLNINGHNIGTTILPITTINLAGGNLTNAANIVGTTISLGSGLTITGTPKFILPNGGILNSALAPLNLPGGSSISGGGATAATINGNVVVGSGANLSPGTAVAASSLQFSNDLTLANGSTLTFKVGPTPGAGNDLITVAGNLTLNGTIGLNLTALGSSFTVGSNYTLFNYNGTLTGNETNFSVPNINARTTYSIVQTSLTPQSIQLSITGTPSLALTYIGNANNNWDLKATSNFHDISANTQQFFNLDTVTFDDTSVNTNPVQIVGTLLPGGVTVSAARDYTFSGTGALSGAAGLNKSGTGNLFVTNNNTYTGVTDIEGGTVNVGNGGPAGTLGAGNITNNGNLVLNRSDSITLANAIAGTGTLTILSGGTVTLTGASTYSGPTNINSGITKISNSASLGGNTGGAVAIASGATLDLGGDATTNDSALNFASTRKFIISGAGVGGVGAIFNSGVSQQNAFNNIQLAADATVGGARFDIGRTGSVGGDPLDLQGHTLTINMSAGGSLFAILADANVTSGQIVVNTGGLSIERTAHIDADGSSTITYNSGTTAFFFAPIPADITRPMIFKGGNLIGAGDGTAASAINSPITLQGTGSNTITLEPMSNGVPAPASNFPLALNNNITESSGTFSVNKLGVNTNVLAGASNSWSGASTLAAGTLEFAPNSVTATSTSSIGSYAGNGTMTVDAAASVTSGALQIAALNVKGSLKIRNNASTPAVSKVSALALAGSTGAWTGALDITNSKLIVEDSSANHAITFSTIQDQVNFGKTNAAGISTTATLPSNFSMAVVDNAQLSTPLSTPRTTFGGVAVDSGSILVGAELLGDANIDGRVDLNDLAIVLNNFGTTNNVWSSGNFDEALSIDATDVSDVLNNFGQTNPDISGVSGSVAGHATATPEPSSLALLASSAAVLVHRRRRVSK